MAEETYKLTHEELATILVKSFNLHEGIWTLVFTFGIGTVNTGTLGREKEINPTAVIPILSIGLERGREKSTISVDAAVVNPVRRKK